MLQQDAQELEIITGQVAAVRVRQAGGAGNLQGDPPRDLDLAPGQRDDDGVVAESDASIGPTISG